MLLDEPEQRIHAQIRWGQLRFAALARLLQTLPRALHRLQHAVAIEGLQQVVDGVDVEGTHSVLVKGGRKNNLRQLLSLPQLDQLLEDREAVEARHLDVEKHHVGVMGADQVDGLDAVLPFRENIDAAGGVEQILQLFACQFFVVDNEGGDGHSLCARNPRV